MIFKPFKGGRATVDYQMRNKTAKVLRGNPRQTQRLIQASRFAQPYCGMTLSFEEEIPAGVEARILDEFVDLIHGGLDHESLDILIVRHTDKRHPKTGKIRPDYHITTVETELKTGKHITIYHYKKDHDIFYAWERMINIRYHFSRPDDPSRRRTINIPKQLGKDRKATLAAIDQAVQAEVIAGRIKDRSDVVQFFEQAKFTVNRQGNDYLGIEDMDGNKQRLKGLFYDSGFDVRKLAKSPAGTPAGAGGGDQENYGDVEKRFSKLVAGRVEKFQKLYRGDRKKSKKTALGGVSDNRIGSVDQFSPDTGIAAHGAPDEPAGTIDAGQPDSIRISAGTGFDPRRQSGERGGRQNLHRSETIGMNYEEPAIGIDESVVEQIGRIGARARTAADATTGILSATAIAMGRKSVEFDGANSGFAETIANFVQFVAAFDQAVKIARNPLGYLARFLMKKIRIKRQERLPVPPQIPFP